MKNVCKNSMAIALVFGIALWAIAFTITLVGAASAQGLPGLAHQVVDTAQGQAAEWLAVTITSAFFAFLAWIGNKLKIKAVEKFNRDAVKTAISNFADSVIDELQERLLGPNPVPSDLRDLVTRGVKYVKDGSPDAVSELKELDLGKLATQVEAGLKAKALEISAIKAVPKIEVTEVVSEGLKNLRG